MKQFVFCLFAAISAMLLCMAQPCAADTLRVMLHTGSFPPYFFAEGDSRTGTIKDIFSVLARETGDSIEYVRVPFNRALLKFEAGQIDIEPMTNPAWRRNSKVPGIYSIPYTVSRETVLFNSSSYFPFHGPEDFWGKTVGVVRGYRYPEFDSYFADGRIIDHRLENEGKIIQLLLAGRLDQGLINLDFANYRIKKDKLGSQLKAGGPFSVLDIMIRFHPSKKNVLPRFNKAIEKLLNDGTIKRIYDQYR
ncbi:ABC transporter substrate-binding protein [Desulfovibrio sp. JC010]|uniref:substrate-binding periplasmic protein n=1 Tax=Desulfovibrio sp. JC010 TaxID=2593641 RepID=UPI0013D0820D|nr:transporter substrate-binding domain-containing protein [Desulfovibrio sp. JC010]NDV27873.1 amino acid ABC transporter substrate-binding protein [Desulfovibrio sp. JC010]